MSEPEDLPFSTRYLPQPPSKLIPNQKHPRRPLPWSSSKLYSAQSHFGSYQDLWLDRGYHFPRFHPAKSSPLQSSEPEEEEEEPKEKEEISRKQNKIRRTKRFIDRVNLNPRTGLSNNQRGVKGGRRFKPAYLSYLKAVDRYRIPSKYTCEYCEKRKRESVMEGERVYIREEVRDGVEEVVLSGEGAAVEVETDNEKCGEGDKIGKEEEEEEGYPAGFGFEDLPEIEVVIRVKKQKGTKKEKGWLREVKSLDELSSNWSVGSSSWGVLDDEGDLENVDGMPLSCLHHPVIDEEDHTRSEGVVTSSIDSEWEFLGRY
ncbi:hypothetical protein QBC43DRAFT_291003 [Cladorrhinum sp. PSN259]|nr:hypothetical protein QBC43DRAFT_291003 [Cladorrhinum sp. PSN259]